MVLDFGMFLFGFFSFYGVICNFWNLVNNIGGFSLGVVVVVVVGYGLLYLGIDIGGLVCLLVGWCGLVGFKLSFGWIFIDFYYIGCCVGLMICCMDDCLLLMCYFVQFDVCDVISLLLEVLDWSVELLLVCGLRVGL